MGKRSFAARLQQLFSAHDMTLGAPWKRILEFAIPMLIGNLAQQLYNTADSIIVGRYVGDNALAAVGSASPILNLLLALFVGVATGVGILVAQRYGAKDREQLSVVIGNCITLSAIVSVITMIIGALITRPMLELLSTPASIIDWCADYLMIYFLGIAGFAYYNILSGVLRGMGEYKSIRALYTAHAGAAIAALAGADLLVILSDIDGLYDDNPRTNPNANLLHEVARITPEIEACAAGAGSARGTGGMVTKIHAAQIAVQNGIGMVIMNGASPKKLYDLFEGRDVGTYFPASRK